MERIFLKMNELNKYNVINDLVLGKINKNRASLILNLTRRQIDRLIIKFKNEGKVAFIHGNRNKKPSTTISKEICNTILKVFTEIYECKININHLTEILKEDYDISVSNTFIHNLLKSNNLCSVKSRKKTKSIIKKQIKLKQENDILKHKKEMNRHIKLIEALETKNLHPTRARKKYAGELVQMDASSLDWVGNGEIWHIHTAIDDSTGMIVGAYFDTQETLKGYYNITKQMITNFGIPFKLYTDARSVFEYKRKNSDDISKNTLTQFQYACSQLGIEISVTSVPQAKGRVERLQQTLQSRLPIEFKRHGIKKIEQANEFLNHYIQKYNQQFALQLDNSKNVFQMQEDLEKLDTILAIIAPRKIQNGCFIKYNNKKYFPYDSNGEKKLFNRNVKCLVIKTLTGSLYCNINDNIYILEEVKEFETFSSEFDYDMVKVKKEKKKYIPPLTHPWKLESFRKYMIKIGKDLV